MTFSLLPRQPDEIFVFLPNTDLQKDDMYCYPGELKRNLNRTQLC